MKLKVMGFAALVAGGTTAAASIGHADEINGFFQDIQLIITGLKGLIEPLMALLIAVTIALQTIMMRQQKKSKAETKEQTEILKGQNEVLENVRQSVETVKDVQIVSAMTQPNKDESQ